MDPVLLAVVAFAAGAALCWLVLAGRFAGRYQRVSTERDLEVRERSRLEAELTRTRQMLASEQHERTVAATRMAELERQAEETGRFVAESRQQLEGAYAQLSQRALQQAMKTLSDVVAPQLASANEKIDTTLKTKTGDIDSLLGPVREMLTTYQAKLEASDRERMTFAGQLDQQLKELMQATDATRQQTSRVAAALGNPKTGGNWGEMALRRCVEISGLTEHCDFEVQKRFQNEDDAFVRPDMVVRLPNERVIIIDAKAPIDAYQQAMSETDEKRRSELLQDHARNLKRHIDELSRRKYPTAMRESIDFTILFVGGDQFLSGALMADPDLYESAISKSVFLASPTLLVPLLRVVALVWKAEQVEENAHKALEIGQDLYERFITMFDYIEDLGKSLNGSVDKYNQAIRSIDKRLVPKANELHEHVTSRKRMPELSQIEASAIESSKIPGASMRLPIKGLENEIDESPDEDEIAIVEDREDGPASLDEDATEPEPFRDLFARS